MIFALGRNLLKLPYYAKTPAKMIVSFRNDEAEFIWNGRFSKKIKLPSQLHNITRRKLRMIAAATTLETLRVPLHNRLEALKGDREGQWSISAS